MTLSREQKRYLRGLSHHVKPVVTVADKGLSDTVMQEVETALNHHELIKVKLRVDRDTRRRYVQTIAQQNQAELVHTIGQTATYFRRNQKKPVIALP